MQSGKGEQTRIPTKYTSIQTKLSEMVMDTNLHVLRTYLLISVSNTWGNSGWLSLTAGHSCTNVLASFLPSHTLGNASA
jgi:hypothetical protein